MKKIIKYSIIIPLVFLLIPIVYSIDKDKIGKIQDEVKDKKIIKETPDTTIYQMDKNTIRIIPSLKYHNGTTWKKVNTNIKKLKYENYEYGIEDNNFKVYFDPNSTDNKNFIKIKRKKGEIDFGFDGIKKKTEIVYHDNIFIFKDVEDYTSIIYEITYRKVKEYINLSEYPNKNTWTFELNVKDLDYELKDNRMYFYDGGKLVGMFDTPIAWDSTIDNVIPVNLSLKSEGNKLKLQLIVNDTWLENAEYPVVIDPTYDDFEYDTGTQGGVNASLWNWNHTQDGDANYYCTPACSAVDGWDVGVYAGRLNLFSSTCHIQETCTHDVAVWTINNTDIFNASNIANITFSYDGSGYIGTPQSSAWFSYSMILDGLGTFFDYEVTGSSGSGSYSESAKVQLVRNLTDMTEWNVFKDGVHITQISDKTPSVEGALRIYERTSVTGTGAGFRVWGSSYTYYVDFGLVVTENEPPVLTSISTLQLVYNASDTVIINASGVSDNELAPLNMTCCKGYYCIPTVSGNILQGTKWYDRESSEYNDINGYFDVGLYAGIEYIRCNLLDNQSATSSIQRTEYNVISNYSIACEIPNSIWCEDFLYTTTFCEMGWDNIPNWWGCGSDAYMPITNTPNEFYKLFQGSALGYSGTGGHLNPYDFIFYHYFPRTKNPIISASWDMEIGILSTNIGLVNVQLTKDLDDILALGFGFIIGDIVYRASDGTITTLCTSCWSSGVNYNYKVTMYLTIGATYYDNESHEFIQYGANTFNLYQDGIELASNKPLTTNVSDVDPFFLNRIKFYKDAANNLTLDDIVVYKGTIEEYDDTYDYVDNPPTILPNGTVIYNPPEFIPPDSNYWGWKSKEDYCKNNIECCTLTNTSTGMRYVITDQICFMRTGYGQQTGKFRSWMIQNQYLMFVLFIIAVLIIMTILIGGENK